MAVDEGALPELQTTSVSAVVPTSTSGLAAMDIDQEVSDIEEQTDTLLTS